MLKRMNTKQASQHLRDVWGIIRAPGTLRRMRSTGGGPEYLKVASGEVIYLAEKLDAWAEPIITPHTSTASYPLDSPWRRPRRHRAPCMN